MSIANDVVVVSTEPFLSCAATTSAQATIALGKLARIANPQRSS